MTAAREMAGVLLARTGSCPYLAARDGSPPRMHTEIQLRQGEARFSKEEETFC